MAGTSCRPLKLFFLIPTCLHVVRVAVACCVGTNVGCVCAPLRQRAPAMYAFVDVGELAELVLACLVDDVDGVCLAQFGCECGGDVVEATPAFGAKSESRAALRNVCG